jgi:S1-C subfamily serine protease
VVLHRNERGELLLGDVIVGVQGKAIKLQKDLFTVLDELRPGDKVKVDVLREGEKKTLEVTLGGRDVSVMGE